MYENHPYLTFSFTCPTVLRPYTATKFCCMIDIDGLYNKGPNPTRLAMTWSLRKFAHRTLLYFRGNFQSHLLCLLLLGTYKISFIMPHQH